MAKVLENKYFRRVVKVAGLSKEPTENGASEKTDTALYEGDENKERGNWSGKLDFLLSCLGYAVGLGNVWRFPYICYKNGGGAFLIPYTLMLILLGIPIFLLELTMGQYGALSPISMYANYMPLFKGLGYLMFLASLYIAIYYNMVIAYALYYLFASMTSVLPWSSCGNDFNTKDCFNDRDYTKCKDDDATNIYNNGQCYTRQEALQAGYTADVVAENRTASSAEYLFRYVWNISDGIGTMGHVEWKLCLSLLAAWIIVYLCLIKGIKSSGKVVYFTATFPYVVILILLIRGLTLPGAIDGVKFYIFPDWKKVQEIDVWEKAAVQIFYSLSIAGGGLITLASYNKFHNNLIRDTFIVCIGNCLTSFIAGFAIFGTLGYLAKEQGVSVEDVVDSGTGLAYIAYPDVVTRLPGSPVWAILFFFMLVTLGLDSQFAIVENIVTSITDEFPALRKKKTIVITVTCILCFLFGLSLTTQGGPYVLDLMDNYAAGWPYLFSGLVELVIAAYFYGFDNFTGDMYEMCNKHIRKGGAFYSHMKVLYVTGAPLLILFLLVLSLINYSPLEAHGKVLPDWANAIGFMLAFSCILLVPIYMIYAFFWKERISSFTERWRTLTTPTPKWRENAMNAANRDGADALTAYETGPRGDPIRRYTSTSSLNKGIDNPGMEVDEIIQNR